jgi:hypothetical protein
MKTTTYICDDCKKSVGELDLCSIRVTLTVSTKMSGSYVSNHSVNPIEKEVCVDCLKKHGIVSQEFIDNKQSRELEAKNVKTIEDKMLDILEDLGVHFDE